VAISSANRIGSKSGSTRTEKPMRIVRVRIARAVASRIGDKQTRLP